MTQEFGLKNINETRNCFLEEIKQNELMSKRNGFFDCYLVITSFPIGLKTFAITARINKYMSIIKKKKNKHDKIVLLAKSKLNSIKVLTSKALID